MNLLILGAGGHGQVVYEVAVATGQYERIAFLDDANAKAIGCFKDLKSLRASFDAAIVSIGNNERRREHQKKFSRLVTQFQF